MSDGPTSPLSQDIERRTWSEFGSVGLLWAMNTLLHWFGWVIVLERDNDTGEITDAYPARTRWRGFSPEDNEAGIKSLTAMMAEAGPALREEVEQE